MYKILIIVAAVLGLSFNANANANEKVEDIKKSEQSVLIYCGSANKEYQKEVNVAEGKRLSLNEGGFYQIQHLEPIEPKGAFVNRELDSIDAESTCSEFLISNTSDALVNKNAVLARVYFNFDKSTLTQRSEYVLDKLYSKMGEKDIKLKVEGHTDSKGSSTYNYDLGLKRANIVYQYLVHQGAEPNQFSVVTKGEREPIKTNKTANGREKNRRVEIEKI
ncbi:OmpA family protein [Aliivibrio fischeri]|uniref:OmpA family protein n=2 Tax=Aliivibrio fischeri TaxID=668 RepID=UPI0012DAD10A|nr:OmpA family protein [Aliivibrio fischeri]MUL06118.1 OmpA family protein [Aliivibrio fischeri]